MKAEPAFGKSDPETFNPNAEGGLAGTEPSACRADILVCRFTELSSSVSGDWKVARTGRLESLPHTTDSVPTSEFGFKNSHFALPPSAK
jgi:hypothetical protein